ncbi:MAG: cytochrome-c peroxidase [Gammaproteobacteria bacterium]|nr:cytochrome-c peroxidase [Gammaproteobacteria bacterium]NNF67356.1 cytochrome-c peroxidase [Gammaproteobacteria bacterium]
MAKRHLFWFVLAAAVVTAATLLVPRAVEESELGPVRDNPPEQIGQQTEEIDQVGPDGWLMSELETIRSLSLRNLPPLPDSESNRYAQDELVARLGKQLFFDKRLSSNGNVSCASCHQPERSFTDGLPLGVGVDVVDRHTMSLIGVAYSPWLFWDGRADSLWRQALGPLEDGREHGGTRTQYAHVIADFYRDQYETAFDTKLAVDAVQALPTSAGPLGTLEELKAWEQMSSEDQDRVNRIFANIGKAMDAYQRRLLPLPTRFDAYVDALNANDDSSAHKLLTEDERLGLELFIDRADCMHCHNGPLFSNNDFHNTGISSDAESTLAEGRARGAHRVQQGEFSCVGPYSDATEDECEELLFIKSAGADLMSAFRTPSLRNVARTAPYMHNGQFTTLEQVVDHYVTAPQSVLGQSELNPLPLSDEEKAQLTAFLQTLNEQEPDEPDSWRKAP